MPLELGGIRFESFPAVWAEEKIYTNFTYAQCIEIEQYHDKYYANGRIDFEHSQKPISAVQWQSYFETNGNKPSKNIFCASVLFWKDSKKNYQKFGLPTVTKRAGTKEAYERLVEHKNAMDAYETGQAEAAAVARRVLDCDSAHAKIAHGCSGNGTCGRLVVEPELEMTGRLASSSSCTNGGETEILARILAHTRARTHAHVSS